MSSTSAPEPRQESYGLRAWAGVFHAMPQAHRHNELELNYVLRGTVQYLIGGALLTLPPRRLCALWGAVPHQTLANGSAEGVEALWVTVPLARVLAWGLPRALVEPLLRRGCAIERAERPCDETLLRGWIDDLHNPAASAPRAVLLELEARLHRMAARLEPRRRPASKTLSSAAGEVPLPVLRLMRFLADRYRDPMTVDVAARAAHVHPHHAMALFRRHTGLTLHQYLTLQRVAHAQRLLATTRQPIVDVALESGFASLSRFYAAFKAQTGGSPRRFRADLSAAANG